MARKKVKLIHANTGKAIHDASEYSTGKVKAKEKAAPKPLGRPKGTATQTREQRRAQLTEAKRRERARKKEQGLKCVTVWLPTGAEYAEAEEAIKALAELTCEKARNGH